ncbi:hypothetical protein GCM10009799_18750 [Nocardiopsis rhodophaea]|uniref:Uncharacterized protein n=1 Tax=Nocardiopsis rhodophaea TaxID=280238 RepID=A0ABN2SV04_9ACTN
MGYGLLPLGRDSLTFCNDQVACAAPRPDIGRRGVSGAFPPSVRRLTARLRQRITGGREATSLER